MLAHRVELRVFSAPEDDLQKVLATLNLFLPFDLDKEKISIQNITAFGFNNRKFQIISVVLKKQRHINTFLGHLFSKLNAEQKELLTRQLDTRIDEELYFYLRFDKKKLIEENQLWLTDEGSCYHLKISLASFPRNRGTAREAATKILQLA